MEMTMAKSKSTRQRSRKSRSATSRQEQIRMDLIGVRAAVATAYRILHQHPGVDSELATVLARMGLNPLDGVLAELEP
jgi:hypothetical protein